MKINKNNLKIFLKNILIYSFLRIKNCSYFFFIIKHIFLIYFQKQFLILTCMVCWVHENINEIKRKMKINYISKSFCFFFFKPKYDELTQFSYDASLLPTQHGPIALSISTYLAHWIWWERPTWIGKQHQWF